MDQQVQSKNPPDNVVKLLDHIFESFLHMQRNSIKPEKKLDLGTLGKTRSISRSFIQSGKSIRFIKAKGKGKGFLAHFSKFLLHVLPEPQTCSKISRFFQKFINFFQKMP